MSKQPKTRKVTETEAELVSAARNAVSHCNWVVGECASKWTQRYAKGRTDTDFGGSIGMSGDRIFQRRRVYETFSDVYLQYSQLKWSHFYVALNWDDSPECLQWAEENEATVAEMRAWRRALRGEDLTSEPEQSWPDESTMTFADGELTQVRDPSEFETPSAGRESIEPVGAATRTSSDPGNPYTPFRSTAGSPAPRVQNPDVAILDKPGNTRDKSPEQILKGAASSLERLNRRLTPDVLRQCTGLPEKLRNRLIAAVSELSSRVADAGL